MELLHNLGMLFECIIVSTYTGLGALVRRRVSSADWSAR